MANSNKQGGAAKPARGGIAQKTGDLRDALADCRLGLGRRCGRTELLEIGGGRQAAVPRVVEVEPVLRSAWTAEMSRRHGSWESIRRFVREGYERGRGTQR